MNRLSSRQLLGAQGPFAARVQEYQVREGQLQVTDAVERLLRDDGALLCEAGTGIGKTFAYLIPAILSGRKVVISTATKTLQDQIAHRDLPLVQKVLRTNVDVAVMKGLSNYLCRRRYKEFMLSEEALRPGYSSAMRLLASWQKETELGDFSELATLSESAPIRHLVGSSSDTRVGARCPYFDECFVTNMKRDAEQAQIVIVNHHLFFADLAMRGPHPGRVIPDYDAVIFDEAHQIEDTAALFFGLRISKLQVERLLKEVARMFSRSSKLGGPLDPAAQSPTIAMAHQALDAFFAALLPSNNSREVLPADVFKGPAGQLRQDLENRLADLAAAAESRASTESDDQALRESLAQSARRIESLRESLTEFGNRREGRVNWVENVDGRLSISSTPVDMSWTLKDRLFDAVPAVGLMSATLTTAAQGSDKAFQFVRSRLGLHDHDAVQQLSVPSPFDYENRCVLYLPKDLPPPGSQDFLEKSAERIAELVKTIDGGAFVLTTSLQSMRKLHELLKRKLDARLLLQQGERPKDALLSAFRANGAAVLVATSSFWEGVDVPGHALRLVVLEKLPFAVPSDPVFQARGQALEEIGKSSFAHLALPEAAITLKQGFGRLIRREDDFGIVALFDERVHTKNYGKRILAALPPARRTSDLEEVRRVAQGWQRSFQGA